MTPEQWSRVKDVFHAALAAPAGDRLRLAADLCGSDEAIRAEVERLLTAHAQAGDFIEAAAVPAFGLAAGDAESISGRVLGRYQIGPLIGRGGMGAVYRAHDPELQRTVAVKVVGRSDEAAERRLRKEARHASQLNHPNICTIHEVGALDHQPFIVMEFVEGQNLSAAIPEGGLPIEDVLRYGIQIADALAHAHEHGVLHRDLKSANVAVGVGGRIKVLDFGLAHRVAHAGTATGVSGTPGSDSDPPRMEGTLWSMAPEQLRGQPADQRSDIWSFGVLLYEMCAGRRPFAGATAFELSAAIMRETSPPLPVQIPSSVQAIVQRCLVKDPRERYQSAAEVRAALEAAQAGSVEAIGAEAVRGPLRKWWLVAAIVLLLGVGLAGWWMNRRAAPIGIGASGRTTIAILPFENASGAEEIAWLSRGIPSMLLTGLAQTSGFDIVSAQRVHEVLRELGQDAGRSLDPTMVSEIARRTGAGAVVVGNIFKAGSELRIDAQLEDVTTGRVLTGQSVRGTDLFSMTDQLAIAFLARIGAGADHAVRSVTEVSTGSLEAYRLYSQGLDASNQARWDDARVLLERAVAIDGGFAEAYLELAVVANFDGRLAAHSAYLKQAAEHDARLTERNRLVVRAELARDAGQATEASRLIEELVRRFPDTETGYVTVGQLYATFSGLLYDPDKAAALTEAGVATLPSSSGLRNIHAYALVDAGRQREALGELDTYAKLAPREPNPYDSTGEVHLALGDPESAIEFYNKALAVDSGFTSPRNGLAWARGMLGEYEAALAEHPPDAFVQAYLLSRRGRYNDAAAVIAGERQRVESLGNPIELGSLSLLSAMLALERGDHAGTLRQVQAADAAFAPLPDARKRLYLVVAHLFAGIAEARAGRLDAARRHLAEQRSLYRPASPPEKWWCQMLAGEIALAAGDPASAAAAFAAGEPAGRMPLVMNDRGAFFANLFGGDGAARAKKAAGDVAGAVELYRKLTAGPAQRKSAAMLEPRYVFELARLLDQLGDVEGARTQSRRFAELWKQADGR